MRDKFQLIVHNNEHNSFEEVIYALVSRCDHTFEQAEQCALLIHYKGKYPVLTGPYKQLVAKKYLISDLGLDVTIE